MKSLLALVCLSLLLSSFNFQASPSPADTNIAASVAPPGVNPATVPDGTITPNSNANAIPGANADATPVTPTPAEAAAAPAPTPAQAAAAATPTPAEAATAPVAAAPVATAPAANADAAAATATAAAATAAILATGPYPPSALTLYIVEPYFYSNDVNNQVIAHLFCGTNGPTGVIQCAVYDSSDVANARLLAIEYVINETTFNSAPAEEQRFWHSHAYGVQSGNIIAPGLSGEAYATTLAQIAASYGKTVYLWSQTEALPIGDPILAFSFTGAGQFGAAAGAAEDTQTNTTSVQRAANNANITVPTPAVNADNWDATGIIPVFNDVNATLPAGLWGLTFAPPAQ